MLEYSIRRRHGLAAKCPVDRRVTNVAVIADNLSFVAEMLSVVAAKTALGVKMADVIG